MRKRIILATSVVALTTGSIFSFTNMGGTPALASTQQCAPECCNDNGDDCGPAECGSGDECCVN